MSPRLTLPLPAEMLVPHRPPMRLIDELVGFDGSRGVVEASVQPGNVLVREDGSVEPMAIIELIAQSFAAVKGYSDLLEGKPLKKGFLVEVKHFVFNGTLLERDKVSVVIERIGETAEFALAEGKVIREGETIASGKVMVWLP